MKAVTWNVNGLRACEKKGFADFFRSIQADFFCIQETKMQTDQLSQLQFQAEQEGYFAYWNSAEKKGYSGTAVFTKHQPIAVTMEMTTGGVSNEGRVLTLEYENFFLVNAYVPNVRRDLERIPLRMEWEDALRAHLLALDAQKPVLYCGDLNVAHQPIDLKNAKPNEGNAGYTLEERGKFTQLLQAGFSDAFRVLYPDRTDAYTWWSYMGRAREKNVGWRIDYWVVSERLAPALRDCIIHADVMGSDHCPLELQIDL
ncbi:MAG: exodeoxyribonuclease III [Oscillospiraceae bacterium]|nr:exodeoxyribonuclease III [Oscillospiraceae bacterium]